MQRKPVRRSTIPFLILILCGIASPAIAGDAEAGRGIARQWCQECHLADGNRRASDVAPPFAQIAADPAYTDARLRNWLHDPHPPMPKFELDRHRIEDIIAYIRSLQH